MTYPLIGGPLDGGSASRLDPMPVVVDQVPVSWVPMTPWRVGYYIPLSLTLAVETKCYLAQKWVVEGEARWFMVWEELPEDEVRNRILGRPCGSAFHHGKHSGRCGFCNGWAEAPRRRAP